MHAEHMGIVLHEPPHTSQAGERTRGFVSMNDTELGHSDRQLLVTTIPRVEDDTVAGAVHGFESPFFLLDIESEHVLPVVLPVARSLPKLGVVHVGGNNYDTVRRKFCYICNI